MNEKARAIRARMRKPKAQGGYGADGDEIFWVNVRDGKLRLDDAPPPPKRKAKAKRKKG